MRSVLINYDISTPSKMIGQGSKVFQFEGGFTSKAFIKMMNDTLGEIQEEDNEGKSATDTRQLLLYPTYIYLFEPNE